MSGECRELMLTDVALNEEEKGVSGCIPRLLCPSVGDPRGGCYSHAGKIGWSLDRVAVGTGSPGGSLRDFARTPQSAWVNFLPHLVPV